MKLQHIVRDSSSGLFNLENLSVGNHYPKLVLDGTPIDIINSSNTIATIEKYLEKDFNGKLTSEALINIVDYFYTNQIEYSISERLKFQPSEFRSYMIKEGIKTEYTSPNFLSLTTAQEDLLRTKAIQHGYDTSLNDDESIRQVSKFLDDGTKVEYDQLRVQQYNPREDLSIKDIYKTVEELDLFWRRLKEEINKEGDIISSDLSRTLGSVVPVFGDIEFQEGYNILSATVMYEEHGSSDIYKESINIKAEDTEISKNSLGIQLVWVKPNTPYSLVKLIWDKNTINSARITNLKLGKSKSNE